LQLDEVRLSVNGRDAAASLTPAGPQRWRGVVEGLAPGTNTPTARVAADGHAEVNLTLQNHARTRPIFSRPPLMPFECRAVESGLGRPIDGACSVATRVDSFYVTTGGERKRLPDPTGPPPADVATTTTTDGVTVPFIVRVESLTINRSIVRIGVLNDP